MKIKVDRRLVSTVLFIILFGIVILALVLLLGIWERQHYYVENSDSAESGSADDLTGDVLYDGVWYEKKSVKTFLLVGVDKYLSDTDANTYITTQQSDFLMLVVIDDRTESYKVLHINRDTMTDVNVLGVKGDILRSQVEQIALAHTYGTGQEDSAENTVTAVSNLLGGVDIDHYVTVTMDAVITVNDAIGGVTLVAMDTINDDIIEGETVTLLGDNALMYVRKRLGLDDSTNLHRMERQQQYLMALKEQFEEKSKEDAGLFLSIVLSISEYMVTDCSVNQLSEFYNAMSGYEQLDYLTLEGEAILGEEYIEFYPDEEYLESLIIDLFYTPVDE